MENETELIEIFRKLNKKNRFAVLVYARMKVIRQVAGEVKPYVRERRSSERRSVRRVHWIGLGM